MRLLVTGAAGNLGSAAVRCLLQAGYEVTALDKRAAVDSPVPVREVNLIDADAVRRLMDGIEGVVHLGNYIGMGQRPPTQTLTENTAMNMNVFQAALEAGVRKIVFASSVQVIASESRERHYPPFARRVAYLPLDGDSPPNPGNAYALSKSLGETMLRQYVAPHGVCCVSLRFPKLLGTGGFESRRQWSAEGPFTDSHITQGFSLLSFADAAAAIEATLRAPLPGCHVFFPAVSAVTGDRVKPALDRFYRDVPLRRPAEQLESLVDYSALTRASGWTPRDSF